MNTNLEERPQFDPYLAGTEGIYVLCENIIVAGMPLQFGDRLPDYADVHHVHVHYGNGVIGTKAELESLLGPIELAAGQDCPTGPVALFTTSPSKVKAAAPLEEKEIRGDFAIANAELLKTKDDLVAYAELFGIQLKKASNISIKKMLETLEAEAKEKGLLK